MIKYAKYLKFIPMAVSITCSIIFLYTFASIRLHYVLLVFFGGTPEICKILLLQEGLDNYYIKKSSSIKYFIIFLPFLCFSLLMSISFVLDLVQNEMYIVEVIEDSTHYHNYQIIEGQINILRDNISKIEEERIEERNRFNALIDSLPTAYVAQRRRLLEDRELLMDSYETRISGLRMELHAKENELIEINTTAIQSQTLIENRRLNNNSGATGFFTAVSSITGAEVETTTLWLGIILGIFLDLGGVTLAFLESSKKIRLEKEGLKKDEHGVDENEPELHPIDEIVPDTDEGTHDYEIVPDTDEDDAALPTEDSEIKISKRKNTYENFKKCIVENDFDVALLKYREFKKYYQEYPDRTFYSHIKEYRKELGISRMQKAD